MIKIKKTFLFVVLLLSISNIKAQDYLLSLKSNEVEFEEKLTEKKEVQPAILNETFTYKFKGDDVLVVFKENEHIEYFKNGKYYIKSKITWLSKKECYMTIKESNLPNFPFKKGKKLYLKITKVKKGKIYYESTLGGRTWKGKLIENGIYNDNQLAVN